ncbi:MAG: PAS/PAC and GAF sensor-containing diguanylate cyclase/phosphodiesterase [Comamonadaceae bacterium]|nr:MAG: PAS/PAC and GAF sensor-containing diguanylate cyclase/phosphodiesterase [Comamonadaceae bacterium]
MNGPNLPPAAAPSVDDAQALRQRAEAHFLAHAALGIDPTEALSPQAMRELLHELQVHQIELELQNEELRDTQAALDSSRAMYFDFYELAPVGYLTVNERGLIKQANLTSSSLIGVLREALIERPITDFIHQQDQDTYYLFRQRLMEADKSLLCELQMSRPDGSPFWVQLVALVVPDQDGHKVLRMVLSDVSERKQAEEKFMLAASVFSHAHEGIFITDAQANILEVNAAFTRITGYGRAEVLGRNPRFLRSDRHDRAFYTSFWRDLQCSGYWCGEIWNRRKNGEVYVELLDVSMVRDAQGQVQRYVALFTDISVLKAHAQQLDRMAHFDALTGLPNRVLTEDRLQQAMALTRRSSFGLALVYIDLDGFKCINDQHGHDAGDKMLIAVAQQMQQVLREGDTLARIGGDEFVAILIDMVGMETCAPLLQRLLTAASQPLQLKSGEEIQVSASLGVSFYPQEHDVGADQLVRQADHAMFLAKQAGKNRYQVFDAEQDSSLRGWYEDMQQLRQALISHEFVLFYQPKVAMRSGQIIGVEALIRWQHPEKGLLAPAAFLPTMENDPLMVDFGEWVLEAALTQMEVWLAQGLDLSVSINVGAHQLQQANFVERLRVLLARHPKLDPTQLEVEILETSVMQDLVHVSQVIEDCRQLGVPFSLDDFGTGYSSLQYLKRLRVAKLKIDQGFVRGMLDDPDDQAILQGIMGLAQAFKLEVIAEGVETMAHVTMLLQLGCEQAQGYAIARPMPAQDLPGWIAGWKLKNDWRCDADSSEPSGHQ